MPSKPNPKLTPKMQQAMEHLRELPLSSQKRVAAVYRKMKALRAAKTEADRTIGKGKG